MASSYYEFTQPTNTNTWNTGTLVGGDISYVGDDLILEVDSNTASPTCKIHRRIPKTLYTLRTIYTGGFSTSLTGVTNDRKNIYILESNVFGVYYVHVFNYDGQLLKSTATGLVNAVGLCTDGKHLFGLSFSGKAQIVYQTTLPDITYITTKFTTAKTYKAIGFDGKNFIALAAVAARVGTNLVADLISPSGSILKSTTLITGVTNAKTVWGIDVDGRNWLISQA